MTVVFGDTLSEAKVSCLVGPSHGEGKANIMAMDFAYEVPPSG